MMDSRPAVGCWRTFKKYKPLGFFASIQRFIKYIALFPKLKYVVFYSFKIKHGLNLEVSPTGILKLSSKLAKNSSWIYNIQMRKSIIFLALIFASNIAGMYFNMYRTWWFDMAHHFLGGFFVAMLMVHYLEAGELGVRNQGLEIIKKYLIILGAVSFIGIVWEFAEYLAAQTLIEPLYDNFGFKAYFIGDLDDTINDLLMDILGAFTYLFAFSNKIKSGSK